MPPWLSSPAKLALAEGLLFLGKYRAALAKADEAIGDFPPSANHEFQWRALVIAARASRLLGNHSTARDYALSAQDSLSSLQEQWGDADYTHYSKRYDIKSFGATSVPFFVLSNKNLTSRKGATCHIILITLPTL